MKQIKYNLIVLLSAIFFLLPFAAAAVGLYFFITTKSVVAIVSAVVCAGVGILLKNPLREWRVKARREVEYDEYGLSKSKGKYEYLSKAERDQMDLQKTADMERLVNTTAIKKMTTHGPEDPMKALEDMIGLEPVKESVREMVARMQFEAEENKKKKNKKEQTRTALSGRHMVFYGPPGTGKTTVARIMTSFLHKYGYIRENKCIEIDGNFLKAGTESALKTELILRHAYGGVLFIDEAYALMDSGDGSGEQVIATLIKQMEDQRDKFILIIAGYQNEMTALIAANPGFESRLKEYLSFPDYDEYEMRDIFCAMARQQKFEVDEAALSHYDAIVARERNLKSFGNGRTARNILDKVIDKHTLNISTGRLGPEDRYRLCACDFQNIKLGGIGYAQEY